MDEHRIRERLRGHLMERLAANGFAGMHVEDGMDLVRGGLIDSFALLELLALVEEDLGVRLDLDALATTDLTSLRGLSRAFAEALSR